MSPCGMRVSSIMLAFEGEADLTLVQEGARHKDSRSREMADHLDRIGQQVGDYRLLRRLGGGGFGDVYLAEQAHDHAQVAIKLLRIHLTQSEELKAFINEARTIRLKHPHIMPLLDFGISREGIPFLV